MSHRCPACGNWVEGYEAEVVGQAVSAAMTQEQVAAVERVEADWTGPGHLATELCAYHLVACLAATA